MVSASSSVQSRVFILAILHGLMWFYALWAIIHLVDLCLNYLRPWDADFFGIFLFFPAFTLSIVLALFSRFKLSPIILKLNVSAWWSFWLRGVVVIPVWWFSLIFLDVDKINFLGQTYQLLTLGGLLPELKQAGGGSVLILGTIIVFLLSLVGGWIDILFHRNEEK